MKVQSRVFRLFLSIALLVLTSCISSFAQDGKLVIHVTPKQAYIFADGRAISEASKHHSLSLSAGEHKIQLANYGYIPSTQTVTITAGKTTNLDVTLTPVAGTVSGPFGAMTIEGADRDAILLNGKTPDYFVGHGDEFNHDWWWKQELVVPPGSYQVSVLSGDKEVWAGPVDVPANQRVVVDIPKGVRKTVAWPRGDKLSAIPRFTVGTASATVALPNLPRSYRQLRRSLTAEIRRNSIGHPPMQLRRRSLRLGRSPIRVNSPSSPRRPLPTT